jgi:hypothetical protein
MTPRYLLFLTLAIALVLGAIVSGGGPSERAPGETSAPSIQRRGSHQVRGLRGSAERFVSAFLAAEVDPSISRARASIRSSATPEFAEAILATSASGESVASLPARIQRLEVHRFPGRPPRALISGAARRGGGVEEFSFAASVRAGRWLIAGPGE